MFFLRSTAQRLRQPTTGFRFRFKCRHRLTPLAFTMLGLLIPLAAVHAAEPVSKPEAEAMVKKALTYLKVNGKERTYLEINKKDGQFVDRDLYLTVYGYDGMVLAHGANDRMIGKNLIEIKDIDGKAFVRERIDMAKKKAPFWQEYKFTNPITGKIKPKAMYCVPQDTIMICGGVYVK